VIYANKIISKKISLKICKNFADGKCTLAANPDKLSALVESGDNFDETINSLEKMDSYLN